MTRWRRRGRAADAPTAAPGVSATAGSNAAGRDLVNPVAIRAEFALPAEAYAPIPDDAARAGVSNIRRVVPFVGRAGELGALEAAFARAGEVVVHAVHGLGGVGKSALAAHWAAHRGEQVRWWITAEDPTKVDAGLSALARALHPGLVGLPAELQTQRAFAWLAGHDDWLLVLDNVEDPAHIDPLLDRVAGRGRVLITTRRATGWHRHATTIRLGVLESADALDLFTRILTHQGPREVDGAAAVCAELGHLALAVEQAAAYCAETGTAPRAYLDMLDRWPAAMFAATTANGDSQRTVARIWRLTLNRLVDIPLTGELLRILAWYAPDHIPRDLLAPLAAPPELAAAIGRLVAYSMITDNQDGTLTVHRLVQTHSRTPDPDDPHRRPDDIAHARDHAAELLAAAFPTDVDHPSTWPTCRALLPHTDALTRRHTPDHDTDYTAYVLDRAAYYRLGQGAPAPAIHALRRALTTSERVSGADHPRTLLSRNNLADAYALTGDLRQAIPLHEKNIADTERVLGADHPNTLTCRNNLALSYQLDGDPERAIPLHEKNVADAEEVLGAHHPDTVMYRNNLAGAYRSAGNPGRAIKLYKKNVADAEEVLGAHHPNTLTFRHNLAFAYQVAGNLRRAIPLHEHTLAERERVLTSDHPDTLMSRYNLASAHESAGDLGQAIPLYERALADSERALSPGHPLIATVRVSLERALST
ncbi:tetratricopeptide repeat protein [Embleya sp. NPDC059237]|uniref:tetratricopeptide repeat protein n=1 Tax=Embleya sp. NPDC059237 TaxID=3346784 RepID=UPI0036D02DE5